MYSYTGKIFILISIKFTKNIRNTEIMNGVRLAQAFMEVFISISFMKPKTKDHEMMLLCRSYMAINFSTTFKR